MGRKADGGRRIRRERAVSQVVITDLHKTFPDRAPGAVVHRRGAIDGLNLEIEEGEFFVLLGPSGCGKTTTLRCVAGLETPTSGSIAIGGQTVADPASSLFVPPEKRSLGMMFQSYALWPHMTVAENVAYPLRRRRASLGSDGVTGAVARNLALVGLSGLEGRYPAELSGGQQQRVALARAVAAEPRLLLFDEPLSNLDAQLRSSLRVELRRIHDATGATSIHVTHDQTEALALADRIAVLREGRVEQVGTADEVFLRPTSAFVAAFVGYENILPGTVTTPGGFRVEGWSNDLATASIRPASAAPAAIAVRASAISFSINEAAQGEELSGLLKSVAYTGERYLAQAEFQGRLLHGVLPLSAWSPSRKASGEAVSLHVARSDVVLLPAADFMPAAFSAAA